MKSFKEYMTGTEFEIFFDIDLLPDGCIRGKGLLDIYKDYIGDSFLMKRYICNSWLEYFRYYLNHKTNEPTLLDNPIR